jgi:hypothetical protein
VAALPQIFWLLTLRIVVGLFFIQQFRTEISAGFMFVKG